ncbi:MAG: glycoside hydrolase family 20 zincin-like fold domain-containing protein, partial [Alistipes sp.]|nr:glycoside hydrolase family 20 zincin-like fold domain-containing protein [Alistipes sp.]
MKISLNLLVFGVATLLSSVAFAIIPQPKSMKSGDGDFTIKSSTVIAFNNEELRPLAVYMLDYLAVKRVMKQTPTDNFISIELQSGFAPEAYSLKVSDKGVSIVASDYGGAFCGVQTLMQL